jgi:hypothetical protein
VRRFQLESEFKLLCLKHSLLKCMFAIVLC